ncbi:MULTISPECIES: PIN domain-containing protein [Dermabacter]|uniref:PIN domain-containing protein n=1 Tax=Dermabacter jinjuensis TaxID=1667168 RepID=A0ABN5DL58_9MICO|nr:PIN domain-containing protein [Dermabacter jinjuensis]ATH95813.1 PIN domain-containing protein [Dermabacter jinjuensis]MDK8804539.1 PIN domain-containing protein [Dermabacter hominis]MDU5962834.1 PIN domain-containing protein [Dermabacter sp.]UEB89873.1 PIN domain-containing protein [Dermabacter jinjuensis]
MLRRQGRPVQERELLLRHVDVASITDAVLSIAEAMPQHVRSLDAIHLATALQLGSAVTVVSYDKQMLAVAQDWGLTVCDPLSS